MEMTSDLKETYRKNPFRILSASPGDPREALIRLQGDQALFGDAAESARALAELLHPESRLEAEMRWFPQTDRALIDRLFAWLDLPRREKTLPRLILPCHLANFNYVRLVLSEFPIGSTAQLHAVLRSLSVAADALLPRQVMAEINGDRNKAGFALLSDTDAVVSQLRALFTETVRFTVSRSGPAVFAGIRALSGELKKDYTDRSSPYHGSFLLRVASEDLTRPAR